MAQIYIGVDVAKNRINIYDVETGPHRRITAGKSELRHFACKSRKRIVVFEASGGYEHPLMAALSATDTSLPQNVSGGSPAAVAGFRSNSRRHLGGGGCRRCRNAPGPREEEGGRGSAQITGRKV
jgi:hypothetical protein